MRIFCQPFDRASLSAHERDVEVAVEVHCEGETGPVRTKDRLEVIAGPLGQGDRFSSFLRELPDVTAHGEREPFAVGAPARVERSRRDRWQQMSLDTGLPAQRGIA